MRRSIPVTLALLLPAAPIGAVEFVAGWDLDGVWDSNVLRQNIGDEDSDLSMRTGPDLTIRERQGDLTYELRTQARYENYGRLDSLDHDKPTDLDFFASGNAAWQMADTTTLSISDSFSRTNSLSALLETEPAAVFDPSSPAFISTVRPGRQRFATNDGSATLSHSLGPLWTLTGEASSSIFDPADDIEADSYSVVGSLQLTRALTRRLLVGASSVIQRNVSVFDGETITGNTLIRGGAVIRYQFSPTLRVEMNAGPGWSQPDDPQDTQPAATYLAVDPSTCGRDSDGTPVFRPTESPTGGCTRSQYRDAQSNGVQRVIPGAFGAPLQEIDDIESATEPVEGTLSYYGTISLSKTWRNLSAELSFDRSQNNRSQGLTATINTALSSSLRWTPTQHWTFTVNGTYSLQTAAAGGEQFETLIALRPDATLVPDFTTGGLTFVADDVGVPFEYRSGGKLGGEQATFTTWRFEFTGERRISRNLSLSGSASYYKQISDNQGASASGSGGPLEAEIIRVLFGMTWTFDPIPL